MGPEHLWCLSRINLFVDLDQGTLARLDGIMPMVTVPRGATFLRPGESATVLYLLKHGRVRLYRCDAEGRALTLAVLGDGNVFGSTDLVALGSADMYAEAMEPTLLCAMRQAEVERLLRQHPEVGMRLIGLLSRRVRELEVQLHSLAHEDVRRRLMRLLLQLSADVGAPEGELTRIGLPLSHEEMASMVGSTRETVTATLSRLTQEGVVRTGRREIAVHRERARALLEPDA